MLIKLFLYDIIVCYVYSGIMSKYIYIYILIEKYFIARKMLTA